MMAPARKRANRRSSLWWGILFAVYFLVYWYRLYFLDQLPFNSDTVRFFYPSFTIGKALLKEGTVLWDPFRNMGQPFLASPSNQALYPLRFLSSFVTYLVYQKIFVLFHASLMCVFGYLLGKKMFDNHFSALFVGLALGFGGFTLARSTFPTDYATLAWTPVVLYFLFISRPLLFGFSLALQWLAGFPTFFLFGCLTYLFSSLLADDKKKMLKVLFKGGFFALGLICVQFFPFLEMMKESQRGFLLDMGSAMSDSIHPFDILKLLVYPAFLPVFFQSSWTEISYFYLGPISLFLFGLGCWKGDKRDRSLALLALVGLVLAMGKYNGFYGLVPFMNLFRFPAHWIFLYVVGSVLVAGSGLRYIRDRHVQTSLVALVAFEFLLMSIHGRMFWRKVADFEGPVSFSESQRLGTSKGRIFHKYPIIEKSHEWNLINEDTWAFFKMAMIPSYAGAMGIPEAISHSNLTSHRTVKYYTRLHQYPISSELYDYAQINEVVIFDPKEMGSRTPTVKNIQVVLNPDAKSSVFTLSGKEGRILEKSVTQILIEAEGPDKVVFSESFHPGWQGKVDGMAFTPQPFEGQFLSVDIPKGIHRIQFYYRPFMFVTGLAVTFFTLIGVPIYLVMRPKYRFRPPKLVK